jgi:hypothetical protein
MGSQIDDFLNQKMDRKQFLKSVGAGLIAVVGVGTVVRVLQQQTSQQSQHNASTMGYGSSVYGGGQQQVGVSLQPKVKS